MTFPPGEEGFLQSHAGGEAVLHDILGGMTNSCIILTIFTVLHASLISPVSTLIHTHRKITSSNRWMHGSAKPPFWQQHTFSGSASEIQYPRLVVKNLGLLMLCHSTVYMLFPLVFYTTYFFLPHADLTTHQFSHSAEVLYTNKTHLLHSFFGTTPEKPTLPFFLELLEIYWQLQQVCPQFSLDALAKALYHLHHVCDFFSPCLKNQESNLANLISLTNLVQRMMLTLRFNVKSSSGSTMHCLRVPIGIRCMFVHLVYTRLMMSPS